MSLQILLPIENFEILRILRKPENLSEINLAHYTTELQKYNKYFKKVNNQLDSKFLKNYFGIECNMMIFRKIAVYSCYTTSLKFRDIEGKLKF